MRENRYKTICAPVAGRPRTVRDQGGASAGGDQSRPGCGPAQGEVRYLVVDVVVRAKDEVPADQAGQKGVVAELLPFEPLLHVHERLVDEHKLAEIERMLPRRGQNERRVILQAAGPRPGRATRSRPPACVSVNVADSHGLLPPTDLPERKSKDMTSACGNRILAP